MPKSARRPRVLIAIAALRWLTAAAVLALLAWGAMREIGTSHLQAKLFSRWAGGLTFGVADGASEAIRFPKGGPYDERLGYAGLPGFIESLTAHGFKIESQARWSPGLVDDRRSQAVPDLRRKGPGRAAHPRPEGRRNLSRPVPGAGLSRFRQHSEPGRQHAAVCRGPLRSRPAKPGAQSGDRMETLRAGRRGAGGGAGRLRRGCRRRQHAGHPDREVPPLARRPHRRRHGQAAADDHGLAARLL